VGFLLSLITSKWGLRVGGVLLIVIALGLVAGHYRAKWKAEGAQERMGKETADAEKKWEGERTTLIGQVKQADQEKAAAEARAEQANREKAHFADLAQQLGQQLAQLAGQRQQTAAQVDRLRDDQLERSITDSLGIRKPGDTRACFYPGELRVIAHAVEEYPICKKQVREFQDQVKQVQSQIAAGQREAQALAEEIAAIGRKVQAQETYIGQVEGHYAEAFNAIPRHRNFGQLVCGALTLGRACKPPQIKLPKLDDLRALRPKI
jgi:septal ring factor EnvC (AmiA/AmiB activator)